MMRSRRRIHNDMPVAVRLNPAFEPRQLWIGQQLGPPPQIEFRLLFLRRKFDA